MAVQSAKQVTKAVDAEDVRQTLEKVLNSKYFVHAYKKRQFLSVICDFYLSGRAGELNEYILAYDVFGRDNTYNPSADPIVRVVAHEIRKKLESYYQNEGSGDEIRMEIPAGSYQPVFLRHPPLSLTEVKDNTSAARSKAEAAPAKRLLMVGVISLGGLSLALAVTVIVLIASNRTLKQNTAAVQNPTVYGRVWEDFLKSSSPPVVVLSNPQVPRLSKPNEPDILLRDSVPLSLEAVEALQGKIFTTPQNSMADPGSHPEGGVKDNKDPIAGRRSARIKLTLNNSSYTGLGEAIGLYYLTNFFHAITREIVLKQSRTLSAEDLKNRNVIMLGGAWVNEWSGKLPDDEDFVYSVDATITNRTPKPGEQREYLPQFDNRNGNLLIDYALITVKPNLTSANKVMVLSGIYSQGTEAAVEFITDRGYLDQLDNRLKQSNVSAHFQVLLKVGVENGIPTTISILALHQLP